MKYYLIAGEASGDLHGSNLIKAIKKRDPQARFKAWGGDKMRAEGANLVKHYRDLAFMGFVEVLMNIRTILRNLKFCKQDLLAYAPDVLVLIDYPGFNMRIAEFARKNNIKVVWYIAPQVWAWKQNRVFKLKRDVGKMLTILPFEKEFFARFDMAVDFVGHPLLDAIDKRPDFESNQRKTELGLLPDKPVLALLPGSRKQEIKAMLPLMVKVSRQFNLQVALAVAPSQDLDFYHQVLGNEKVHLIENRTYDLLEVADAALVTSGTATLETALFEVPEVVCYRGNQISYMIARQLVKVKYISLVNLIMDREIVKELIQKELNEKNLIKELRICLSAEGSERQKNDYKRLIEKLGGSGASDNAARIIVGEAS